MKVFDKIKSIFRGKKKRKNISVYVKHLYTGYGKKEIIKGISFRIKKREIYGIIGLSGSGKSTILKALVGLLNKKGRIDINGKIAFCPQDNAFFEELSVFENIILFGSLNGLNKSEAEKKGRNLLKKLTMDEAIHKPASNLSGGQKKRLNIILSILHEPDVIVLDEPFAGLDYFNRKLLWEFIESLRKKDKSILLTTHLLNEAEEYCSEVLILKDGKKFTSGRVSSILRRRNIESIMEIKFNYLSNEKIDDIKHFCRKNKIRILDLRKEKHRIMFGQLTEQEDELINFLNRKKIKHRISSKRTPTLDDLFLMAVHKK